MHTSERMSPEFDQYAHSYTELLEDPIRKQFARDPLHFHRRKWSLIEKRLKRAKVNAKTQRWLDVGCGRGELLELAGRNFAQAIGCDPSASMLSSGLPFRMHQQPSFANLPFDDCSVDFVTAVCVYHHVHAEARTLLSNEIRRVLTPGGLCCIIEHNPWNPVTRTIVRRCPVDVDAELLTARGVNRLLQAAGFESLSIDYFLYFPEWLFNGLSPVERMLSKVPMGGQYALFTRARA